MGGGGRRPGGRGVVPRSAIKGYRDSNNKMILTLWRVHLTDVVQIVTSIFTCYVLITFESPGPDIMTFAVDWYECSIKPIINNYIYTETSESVRIRTITYTFGTAKELTRDLPV